MADQYVPYIEAGQAAFEQLDDYLARFLLSGDHPRLASYPMTVKADEVLQQFQVLGLDEDGKLVPATYLGAIAGDDLDAASLALTFSGVGTADDTVTIDGHVYTLKAAPAAADEVKIGASAAATAANLAAAINADPAGAGDTYGEGTEEHASVHAEVASAVVTVYAKVPGATGNAIVVAESGTATAWAGGGTVLAGGEGLGIVPRFVCTQAVTGNAEGTTSVPVFYSGCFNPDALVWHASFDSDDKKRDAFMGSPSPTQILIRKRG